MVDDRAATVDDLVLERLEMAGLPKDAYDLLLTVLLGEEQTDGAGEEAEPAGAHLTSIEVQGFTAERRSYPWSPYRYAVYLHWMKQTAKQLGVAPALLELTLFRPPEALMSDESDAAD